MNKLNANALADMAYLTLCGLAEAMKDRKVTLCDVEQLEWCAFILRQTIEHKTQIVADVTYDGAKHDPA